MQRLRLMIFTLMTTIALAACGQAITGLAPTAEPTSTPRPSPTSTPTKTPRPTSTLRPTSTPTPMPTATPTPPPPPQAIIQVEALNVREGPGTVYTVLTQAGAGETLLVTGRAAGLPWVKVQLADAREGWISAKPEHSQLTSDPASLPIAFFRPSSMEIHRGENIGGRGVLTIENKGAIDQVVILSQGGATLLAGYVRGNENLTIERVPDGQFEAFTTSGIDWDGAQFNRGRSSRRFDEPLDFTTTATTYSIWTLTLGASLVDMIDGGNSAPSSAVDAPPAIPLDTSGE